MLTVTMFGTLTVSVVPWYCPAPVALASTAVVYLTGSALGSLVPTPGGLGAVEAALSAGLTAAGLPGATAVSAGLRPEKPECALAELRVRMGRQLLAPGGIEVGRSDRLRLDRLDERRHAVRAREEGLDGLAPERRTERFPVREERRRHAPIRLRRERLQRGKLDRAGLTRATFEEVLMRRA